MATTTSTTTTTTGNPPPRRDRLSDLPDSTLAQVLSHLGSIDATCTSALSTRWRDVHAAVPVIDLVDPKNGDRYGSNISTCFDHQVTAAVLGKADDVKTRTFRLNAFSPPYDLRDQWFAIALESGLEVFDVKLRYWDHSMRRLCPFAVQPNTSADFVESTRNAFISTPPHVFRCDTLRCLRLTNFTLYLPAGKSAMPSLETLCLKKMMAKKMEKKKKKEDCRDPVQRLVSFCPNLVDLTLEECPTVTGLVVASNRLERFAMICCHNATRVVLHTDRLRTLRYRGGLLAGGDEFFSVGDCSGVVALTVDICESLNGKPTRDVIPVTNLIAGCGNNLTFLHLHLRPAMASHSNAFARALCHVPHLRQLSLKGIVQNNQTVREVITLLRNTPNLDVLSLILVRPQKPKPDYHYLDIDDGGSDGDDDDESQNNGGGRGGQESNVDVHVPRSLWDTQVECLHYCLRKINVVNYNGKPYERMLAKYLLSKAWTLEQFSVTLPAKTTIDRRQELTKELKYWRANKRARISYQE
uniref:F-box domain-containing protein n=1 Tax=Leersia perrieri TaxID=77586 RepID=A0A0D9XPU0_9ORYZ